MKLNRTTVERRETRDESQKRVPLSTLGPRPSARSAVALIITLILLAVVTFMALTFLAISRRERNAVSASTDNLTAQLAADNALAGGAYYEESWTVMSLLMMTGNFLDYTAY